MSARICSICGADTLVVNDADGKPVELDCAVPVYLREVDREPARPVVFWAQVATAFGRVEHRHVCRGGK